MSKTEARQRIDAFYDRLTRLHTSFGSLQELIEAKGYFPSLNIAVNGKRMLADEYDRRQKARGSQRRASRYTLPGTEASIRTGRME